ncbi:TerB family tellurite resistance protein [Pseudoxanthobacter sp. M-2]|uniref:TerB family tellurite resistance protein n=1 Tax=Pseudoxanthobacter sp. M-2 TaxID=3078754 RepID=UPI0038FBEDA1
MHIILGAIAVLGTLAFFIVRMRDAASAANDLSYEAKSFWRRFGFRRRASGTPLDAVQEPAEAAAVLLLAVARIRGTVTSKEVEAIEEILREDLGVTDTVEAMARARWLSGHIQSPEYVPYSFQKLLMTRVDMAERRQLVGMLRRVATAEGTPTDDQTAFIDKLALTFEGRG